MSEKNKRSFIRDGLYNINRTMQLDPAAHSKWEVFWLYPHIKAIGLYRIAHWFWVHNHTFSARWVSNKARHWTGIEIHPGAVIGRGLMIDHGMGVVIGETAIIGDDCQLYHGVTLGGTCKKTSYFRGWCIYWLWGQMFRKYHFKKGLSYRGQCGTFKRCT